MLTGAELTVDDGWRIVESDLHNIAGRVREYDDKARLVRDDDTGRLGLARWVENSRLIKGGDFRLARECIDWTTGEPLTGEPDPRVLADMQYSDSHRIKDLRSWNNRRRAALDGQARAQSAALEEAHGEPSEQMVHHMRKDQGIKDRITVPKAVA